tara:strand:+ start:636 stop:899 length:264 start_codon:yes stop_codon:yes gene_type:complete
MNKHLAVVLKWIEDKSSFSADDLESNAKSSIDAVKDAKDVREIIYDFAELVRLYLNDDVDSDSIDYRSDELKASIQEFQEQSNKESK